MSELNIVQVGDGCLKIIGELDCCTVSQLVGVAEAASATRLTLDVSELTFVDSAGLRAIFKIAHARNGSGPLVIRDVPPAIARVLELVGMHRDPHIELRHTQTVAKAPRRWRR